MRRDDAKATPEEVDRGVLPTLTKEQVEELRRQIAKMKASQ